MAEDRYDRLRGERIGERDPWFGLSRKPDFQDFKRWWHREGKKGLGRDLMNRQEAADAYRDWAAAEGHDKGPPL